MSLMSCISLSDFMAIIMKIYCRRVVITKVYTYIEMIYYLSKRDITLHLKVFVVGT